MPFFMCTVLLDGEDEALRSLISSASTIEARESKILSIFNEPFDDEFESCGLFKVINVENTNPSPFDEEDDSFDLISNQLQRYYWQIRAKS
ncbi:hypothetical protein BLA29_011780 [Euroglyphus maynei]|uniref:Uncharacterized protein n=1 Tax=Euroglyphus maynei TaxID=6958 RepID=A0A1Y3ARR6_EURMA|nr:hypothetical protein BLA29_011780 [Euroglyphus maynei]